MSQGEVFFLKMNNGDDLLVQMLGDEEDCLWITQPYLVELIPSVESMTITTSIMRWIPFESLMEEKVRINKINILTYLMVDDIIANKYLNTISEHSREQRTKARERQQELFRQYVAIANTTGSFH
jgi:hypothetical protein